jgi:hypothetical protein
MQVHIKNYLDIVIHQEWPKQQRGEMDHTARVAGQNELLEVNQLYPDSAEIRITPLAKRG